MSRYRTRVREEYRPKAEKLMDQVGEVLRFHRYSYRTEETYVSWILKFLFFAAKATD